MNSKYTKNIVYLLYKIPLQSHIYNEEKSRKEELIEIITQRLVELDELLLLPPDRFSDQEFEKLKQEAIKLSEMLKFF